MVAEQGEGSLFCPGVCKNNKLHANILIITPLEEDKVKQECLSS